jgi:hypothetical protein
MHALAVGYAQVSHGLGVKRANACATRCVGLIIAEDRCSTEVRAPYSYTRIP